MNTETKFEAVKVTLKCPHGTINSEVCSDCYRCEHEYIENDKCQECGVDCEDEDTCEHSDFLDHGICGDCGEVVDNGSDWDDYNDR